MRSVQTVHTPSERLPTGVTRRDAPLVSRMRFQLLGGLFVCVFLPAFYKGGFTLFAGSSPTLVNATVGAAVAVLFGYYWLRRIGSLPGVQSGSHVFVSIALPYALVVTVFFLLRLDYSRFVFVASSVLAIVWFLGMHFLARRLVSPRLAVVPGGNVDSLSRLGGVDWQVLASPPAEMTGFSGVVADLRQDFADEWARFIANATLQGLPVYHSKQLHESLTGKVRIEHLSENNFGSLLPNLAYLKFKQAIDWLAAVLALPLFLLVLAVVAPLIKLESGGPVFYFQKRIGYRGERFVVIKLRTMRSGGRSSGGGHRKAAMTQHDDRRITGFGRFLRRYRIDELPQIINILRGEMSWIGPRPEALTLSRWYESELPFYRYRHVVRPGITGWAQVNQGHVANPGEVLEKLHYDFFYIKHLSPWLDWLIVMKTVRTVLFGIGAK
ncbi:MAG: sugar transferase [Pseudomonadota bacterium]|nr:sugar transferase [Pseudomonadota bacterium]